MSTQRSLNQICTFSSQGHNRHFFSLENQENVVDLKRITFVINVSSEGGLENNKLDFTRGISNWSFDSDFLVWFIRGENINFKTCHQINWRRSRLIRTILRLVLILLWQIKDETVGLLLVTYSFRFPCSSDIFETDISSTISLSYSFELFRDLSRFC